MSEKPPRGKSGWARYFAKELKSLGLEEASQALLAIAKTGKKSTALPRGVYEKIPGSGDYWIRFADPLGIIRRQHIGASLSAASSLAEQRRTEVRLGKFDPESIGRRKPKMTVAGMFTTYLPHRMVRNKREDERYADYWSKRFGKVELNNLSPFDLRAWMAERIQTVKPSTVNRALEYLKAFYSMAIADGHCAVNPVSKIDLLEENSERDRKLEFDEEAKLQAILGEEDFDLVLFAIHTGLRRSEQFKLRWQTVHLEERRIRISLSKSGKFRDVHLNQPAYEVLLRQQKRAGDSAWVFPGKRKGAVPRNGKNFYERVFLPALDQIGVQERLTWHGLRHTFGSRLAQNSQPLYTISTLMGHASTEVTKRYSHLDAPDLKSAVATLSKNRPTDTTTDTK